MPRKYLLGLGILIVAGMLGVWLARRGKPTPARLPAEIVKAVYDGRFQCTLYYTPREAGFREEGGFDMKPATREGLEGRKFPSDFLRAVEKEGFGRMKEPVNGKLYVRYWSGRWGYAEQPIDNRQRPLIPKQSCAMSTKQKLLAPLARISVRAPSAAEGFDKFRWVVADTGSGLDDWQIDLYWGEDDPLGPGPRLTRPKGAPFELANATVTVFQ